MFFFFIVLCFCIFLGGGGKPFFVDQKSEYQIILYISKYKRVHVSEFVPMVCSSSLLFNGRPLHLISKLYNVGRRYKWKSRGGRTWINSMGIDNLACYFNSMGIDIVRIPCWCHPGKVVQSLSEFLDHHASVICYSCGMLNLGLYFFLIICFIYFIFAETLIVGHICSLVLRFRTMLWCRCNTWILMNEAIKVMRIIWVSIMSLHACMYVCVGITNKSLNNSD